MLPASSTFRTAPATVYVCNYSNTPKGLGRCRSRAEFPLRWLLRLFGLRSFSRLGTFAMFERRR